MLLDDKKLSKIRLSMRPKSLEGAARVALDLQRRYDLLFSHLGASTPARLTAVLRWAIPDSKISPRAWKSPIPTEVIEEYLSESGKVDRGRSDSPVQIMDWKQVVDTFISKCDELDQTRGRQRSGLPPVDDQPRKRSRASSRTSSISEGHVSPDDDGPSRKVVHGD